MVFTDSEAHTDTILDHFVLTFNNQNKLMFISDTSIHKDFFKHRITVYETIRRETWIVKLFGANLETRNVVVLGVVVELDTGHSGDYSGLGLLFPLGVLEIIQPLVRGVPLTPQEPLQQLLGARLVPHHLI